jgi:hypothetical protein
MSERSHVWIVNRIGEVDPLYVFVSEDHAREYAARFADAVISEEVVMNGSAGAQFLIDTFEPEDEDHADGCDCSDCYRRVNGLEPCDPSAATEDARNEAAAAALVTLVDRASDDAVALDAIAHILRDPEWGVGMLEDIAAIVGDTERSLDNPSGEPTWMRH